MSRKSALALILGITTVTTLGYFISLIAYAQVGVSTSVTVTNTAPTVSNVVISPATINLAAATTTNVTITADITDVNDCSSVPAANVIVNLRSSTLLSTACDAVGEANGETCYPLQVCTINAGTCGAFPDATMSVTCTVPMQYFADETQSTADNWLATIVATDTSAGVGSSVSATGAEVQALRAVNTNPTTVALGSLAAGAANATVATNIGVRSVGNQSIDINIKGTALTFGASSSVPVGNIKYHLTNGTAYASAVALSGTDTAVNISVPAPTQAVQLPSVSLYFGIALPANVAVGNHTGTTTFTATTNI